VRNYLSGYFQPLQLKMAAAAPKLKLADDEAQKRTEILPALMKGHLLELDVAIGTYVIKNMAKEVEEIQETLAEFLKLASLKYKVTPYVPTRPLSDKELFGPLGCEFWGKVRVEGSNACAVPNAP
jgi:hypothetical protein